MKKAFNTVIRSIEAISASYARKTTRKAYSETGKKLSEISVLLTSGNNRFYLAGNAPKISLK